MPRALFGRRKTILMRPLIFAVCVLFVLAGLSAGHLKPALLTRMSTSICRFHASEYNVRKRDGRAETLVTSIQLSGTADLGLPECRQGGGMDILRTTKRLLDDH